MSAELVPDIAPRPDFTYPRVDAGDWVRIGDEIANELQVFGTPEQTEAFRVWLAMNDFRLLNAAAPIPANLSIQSSFRWRIVHWGTPTEADITEMTYADIDPDLMESMVRICFSTAWSHPQEALTALSQRFPAITFVNTWGYDRPSKQEAIHPSYEYWLRNGKLTFERWSASFTPDVADVVSEWASPPTQAYGG